MFVIGGGTASVQEYLAPERRWAPVPDMPKAVGYAAAVVLNGKLLVIGGLNRGRETLSAVFEYDPGAGSWKELPSLLTARYRPAVCVLGGEVVVLGGWTWSAPILSRLPSVERYNRRLQCWEAMPSLTDPMANLAAVVVQI